MGNGLKKMARPVDSDAPPIVIDQRCEGCGEPVHLEVPVPAVQLYERLLRRQAAGEAPVTCPPCIERAEREADAERERARLVDILPTARQRAGVPATYRGIEFDSIEVDPPRAEAIRVARAWAEGSAEVPGVYLFGEVGRGKTWITAAAAEAVLRRGGRLRWLNVARLLTDLRLPFNSKGYAAAQRALSATRPGEALILDDLDKALTSDRDVQPLYVAIDGWVSAGAPLFVNANGDLDRIATRFGPSFGAPIASRLVGHCIDIEVGGRDRRLDP